MSSYDQASATLRSLEKWTARHLGTIDHERRVAQIARTLIDLTAGQSLLDARHRRLVEWAAIVHDVGRSVNDDRHPQIGAKMLSSADSLYLSKSDRRALAYLTRYHRGAVPRAGKDDLLKAQDDHKQLYLAIAYLRVADALDNRNVENPRLAMRMHQRRLHITAHLAEASVKARRVFRRRRKLKLLEELLDLTIEVTIVDPKNARPTVV